ncbi:MAG: PQQ-binding-like beta-propeller repeat protein, partial [Planctomycetota bacterium]
TFLAGAAGVSWTASVAATSAIPRDLAWPRFGGASAFGPVGLSTAEAKWPADGPATVWKAEVGDGYAGVVADSRTAFCFSSQSENEVLTAFDLASGAERWRRTDAVPFEPWDEGRGPFSTPTLAQSGGLDGPYDRLLTLGVTGRLTCRATKDGAVVWRHDLPTAFDGVIPGHGCAASPLVVRIAERSLVVLPVGGGIDPDYYAMDPRPAAFGPSVRAFDLADGRPVWANGDAPIRHTGAALATAGGAAALAVPLYGVCLGLDPATGEERFRIPTPTPGNRALPPIWLPNEAGDGGVLTLFQSYGDGAGVHAIPLRVAAGRWIVGERRHRRRTTPWLSVPAVRGDLLTVCSGAGAGSLDALTPAEWQSTGDDRPLWRTRTSARTALIGLRDGFLAWREDGRLTLLRDAPAGSRNGPPTLIAAANPLRGRCWAPPALIGRTLLVKNRRTLLALRLGPG